MPRCHCGGKLVPDEAREEGKYTTRRGYCSCFLRKPIRSSTDIAPQPDRLSALPEESDARHVLHPHTEKRRESNNQEKLERTKAFLKEKQGREAALSTIIGIDQPQSTRPKINTTSDTSGTKPSEENGDGIANGLHNVNLGPSLFAKAHPLVEDYTQHLKNLHAKLEECIAKDEMHAARQARTERQEFFQNTLNRSVDDNSQALRDLFENDYTEVLQKNEFNIRALMHRNSCLMEELKMICRKEDEITESLVKKLREEANPHKLHRVKCMNIFHIYTKANIKEIKFPLSYNVDHKQLAVGLLNLLVIPKFMKTIVERLEERGRAPMSIWQWYLNLHVQEFVKDTQEVINMFRSEAKYIKDKRKRLRKPKRNA